MSSALRFAAVLALLALPAVSTHHAQYTLYHRLYHPSEPQGRFQQRGTVTIAHDNSVSFHSAPSFADDIYSFAGDLKQVRNKDLLLYQVALERDGDKKEEHWDISSVKAVRVCSSGPVWFLVILPFQCHLSESTSEQIYLHTVDVHVPIPYAINYFVTQIPHDGACPKSRSKKTKVLSFESFAKANTTVMIQGSHFPPLPHLASPPPITPDGQPVTPVPEKTFLQKYWMYIAALLLATMLAGGGEEEKPARRE
ncbi:hypothetical protein C0993_000060 [Termitomyces sp. T159_Od127]|nr:hypothetical protein C0993_000060 [Termitomyces sp. T159_Od127]